jgi:hypothetical protein
MISWVSYDLLIPLLLIDFGHHKLGFPISILFQASVDHLIMQQQDKGLFKCRIRSGTNPSLTSSVVLLCFETRDFSSAGFMGILILLSLHLLFCFALTETMYAYKKLGYGNLNMFGVTKRLSWKRQKLLYYVTLPKSLPCRDKYVYSSCCMFCGLIPQPDTYWTSYLREMEEISTFVKDAICNDQCLGRCLYIHSVPGTGKVSVHIFLVDFTFFILSG